jgi:hypothetical protein
MEGGLELVMWFRKTMDGVGDHEGAVVATEPGSRPREDARKLMEAVLDSVEEVRYFEAYSRGSRRRAAAASWASVTRDRLDATRWPITGTARAWRQHPVR